VGEVRDMDEDSPNDSPYEMLAKHDQSETKRDIRGDYGRTQKGDSYDIGELFYPEICGDTGDSAAWLRTSCDR
jgi:hypothetical protein